jgi:hypothetical protein
VLFLVFVLASSVSLLKTPGQPLPSGP